MTRSREPSRRRFLQGLAAGAVAGTSFLAAARRAAAKKRGGTLTVGMPQDCHRFDPHNLVLPGLPIQQNFYDTLIRYDQSCARCPVSPSAGPSRPTASPSRSSSARASSSTAGRTWSRPTS